MTEHGHNFIREIAEAYRALEAEQGHLDTIARHEKQRVTDGETIARLELRIMEMKAQQDETQAKLRSVEAERDEAGFRALEAEDRLDGIKRAVGLPEAVAKAKAEGIAEATPKPVEPSPVQYQEQGQSVTTPTEPSLTISGGETTGQASEGQSVADPIAASPTDNVLPIAGSSTVAETAGASEPIHADIPRPILTSADPSKPYHNKRYHDHPYYVSLQGWLNGGGTEDDYNWRPEAQPPAQAAQ